MKNLKRKVYTKADFAWTAWDAGTIQKVAQEVLVHKKQRYTEIKSIPAKQRTFENTIVAIERAGAEIASRIAFIDVLLNASPNKDVREACNKALQMLQHQFIDIEYDEDLYRAVQEYSKKKEKLEGSDKKLFDETLRAYRRMGFALPKAKRDDLKKLLKELGKLEIDFSKNINDYNDHILVKPNEIDGLPERYLQHLARDAKGNYIVTLQYPDLVPFLENASHAGKRKELVDKNMKKGGKRNMVLLNRVLKLRKRHAEILGYNNHADFQTEERMAKTAKNVRSFIMDILPKLKPKVREEMKEMTVLKREHLKNPKAKLEYYDISYYGEKLQQKKFNIESEKIREYFPLQVVKKGMLEIYAEILGITFKKVTGYPSWHSDTEFYQVSNRGTSKPLAYFVLDLYPRENKYGHAAVFDCIHGWLDGGIYNTPVAVMMTNFPKPSAEHPSLMSHDEVVTFFHEFGHVMHQILTTATYISQAGTSVARDFVEAPSQMLENWVWDAEMLQKLSGHYKDSKKKLPNEYIQNLLASKNHLIGYSSARQLTLALFDLLLHTSDIQDPAGAFDKITLQYLGIKRPKGNYWPAGFGHLCGGYDAGYYGYMWSKVYSSDMFTRFKKEGLLNKKTGINYRNWILEPGSSKEEIDLIKGFLKREPNSKAFLKEIGL